MKDFTTPEFLLSTPFFNESGFDENRLFITHKGLSLIEIIDHELFPDIFLKEVGKFKEYRRGENKYTLAYHTCNVGYFGLEPTECLDMAWYWFCKGLDIEEKIINQQSNNSLN